MYRELCTIKWSFAITRTTATLWHLFNGHSLSLVRGDGASANHVARLHSNLKVPENHPLIFCFYSLLRKKKPGIAKLGSLETSTCCTVSENLHCSSGVSKSLQLLSSSRSCRWMLKCRVGCGLPLLLAVNKKEAGWRTYRDVSAFRKHDLQSSCPATIPGKLHWGCSFMPCISSNFALQSQTSLFPIYKYTICVELGKSTAPTFCSP